MNADVERHISIEWTFAKSTKHPPYAILDGSLVNFHDIFCFVQVAFRTVIVQEFDRVPDVLNQAEMLCCQFSED